MYSNEYIIASLEGQLVLCAGYAPCQENQKTHHCQVVTAEVAPKSTSGLSSYLCDVFFVRFWCET